MRLTIATIMLDDRGSSSLSMTRTGNWRVRKNTRYNKEIIFYSFPRCMEAKAFCSNNLTSIPRGGRNMRSHGNQNSLKPCQSAQAERYSSDSSDCATATRPRLRPAVERASQAREEFDVRFAEFPSLPADYLFLQASARRLR